MKFALLMSVYAKDSPAYLAEALESVSASSVLPDQSVIVLDGPVPDEIGTVIARFTAELKIEVVPLPRNVGLGRALAIGLTRCRYELVARFDSDDLCMPDRFMLQCERFSADPDLGVLSGYIREFDNEAPEGYSVKTAPVGFDTVSRQIRGRNPLNHMAVMFRKSVILAAGNYQDEYLFEDYALWVRVFLSGAKIDNLPIVLVKARAGRSMIGRRGGFKYMLSEMKVQLQFYRQGLFGFPLLLRNILIRASVRLMPGFLRMFFYRRHLRVNE